MSDTLKQLTELVNKLRLEDIVGPDHRLLDTKPLLDKLAELHRHYNTSGHYLLAQRAERERVLKSMETRRKNLQRVAEWCRRYVKVGDWVKVSGSGSKSPYRKVLELNETVFQNRPGDPVMNNTTGHNTETAYMQITHIMNPATRLMEKIDVKTLVNPDTK